MNNQNAIIQGSLSAMAGQNNKSLAESFLSCDTAVIVDTSGSMSDHDSRGGNSRYDIACQELAQLQRNLPGKIAVISFSNDVEFCPNGLPRWFGGGTNLAVALQFAKVIDIPGIRIILISDGEPSDENEALKIARAYQNKIDVIYVGPEDRPFGRDFLRKLATITGGQTITVDRAKELSNGVMQLLSSKV